MARLSLDETYPVQTQPSTATNTYLSSQMGSDTYLPSGPSIVEQMSAMGPHYSAIANPSGISRSGGGTTMPVAPGIDMPSFGDVPAIDETRIKRLTQTRSAAGQRALRSALRESLLQATYQDNPNVAAMISKKALSGFGQGVAEVYEKAQRQATSEEYRDRQMQFAKQQAVFNAGMQDYLRRFGTTTTSQNQAVSPGQSRQDLLTSFRPPHLNA